MEAAQISSAPIIVTHSNVRALQDHKRSLTDEGIAAVAESKGVIGISGIGDMLGSKPTIHDVVEHIKYIGDNYGWEYVALGSDFLGMIAKTEGFVKFNDILELEKLLEKPDLVLYKNVERVLNKIMK